MKAVCMALHALHTLGIVDGDMPQACLGHPQDALCKAVDGGCISGHVRYDDGYALGRLRRPPNMLLRPAPHEPCNRCGGRPWQQGQAKVNPGQRLLP